MSLQAQAWKLLTGTSDFTYRVQLNNVSNRIQKKVTSLMDGWSFSGVGCTKDSNNCILLYTKFFPDEKSWDEWAKEFPYKIEEYDSRGKLKPKKFGYKTKAKAAAKKKSKFNKRKCSLCGRRTHTARNCPNKEKLLLKKNKPKKFFPPKLRKPVQCSHCGKEGHNSRTCPEKKK